MAVLPDGDVVASGEFFRINGIPANHIARFHPANSTWSPLGLGVSASSDFHTNTLTTVLANGDVIAAGNFMNAGSVPVQKIARYLFSTQTWAPLTQQVNPEIIDSVLGLPNGDLVIGGFLNIRIGPAIASGVARFSAASQTWQTMGSGLRNYVFCLAALPDGRVVAGGDFQLGVTSRNYLAIYDPATDSWGPVGTGVNSVVVAAAVTSQGDLIVGGWFTMAGGMPARAVAKFTAATQTWSALGSGVGGEVDSVSVLPDDSIVVSGRFLTAGGIPVYNMARFSPQTGQWSAMGAGVDAPAWAMAPLPNGDVLIGGEFFRADGRYCPSLARYSFGATADFNHDGSAGTDADIEAFFACLSGRCCATCPADADFNGDGDLGTDADIEAFFRVLAGGTC